MRRFYNPALSPDEADALDWANLAALAAVDAALGHLVPTVRALFVEPGGGSVTLHFVVAPGAEAEVGGDVEDVVADFEAAVDGMPEFDGVVAAVHAGSVPSDWSRRGWQPVYWVKDAPSADEPRRGRPAAAEGAGRPHA